jgi:hypothetical protein
MHQPSSDHQPYSSQPPPFGPPTGDPVSLPGDRAERVDFAKFPPDDDLPGGIGGIPAQPLGGGGFGGGPIGPYDADFKKGRFNPKLVLLAVLLAVGGVVMVVMAMKTESSKMTADQIATIKKNVYVLPKADRVTKWRELGQQTAEYELQQEALMQLGWEGDKNAIPLAIAALTQIDHRIRGVAAQVLASFGSPDADAGKDPLQKALLEADDGDRPQITWALVTLHDPRVFDKAMDLYRKGHLTKVQRLGGGPAFNPEDIARLVTLDALAGMAGDENESVRQLIANIISRNAAPKYTDPCQARARPGHRRCPRRPPVSARSPSQGARPTRSAQQDRQGQPPEFLEALRDDVGGEGLVIALGSVSGKAGATAPEQAAVRHAQIAVRGNQRARAVHQPTNRTFTGRRKPRAPRRSGRSSLPTLSRPHADGSAQVYSTSTTTTHAEAR